MVEMPPVEEYEGGIDIVRALLSLGVAEFNAMGEAPLSWQTLRAWSDLTGEVLDPGAFEAVQIMSAEYVAACQEFRHRQVPPPYGERLIDRQMAAEQLRRVLDGLVASNGSRKRGTKHAPETPRGKIPPLRPKPKAKRAAV